jgi:hypothetical protein
MKIPFAAYADDCTVHGEVALDGDRLSDFLASTDEVEVTGVTLRSLDDGHVVRAESAALVRNDLCLVTATGPRGRPERRVWTRQVPVRARVGPYTVVGYLHAPPSIDPFKAADRRVMVPLTASTVQYGMAGSMVLDHADAVLVNGARLEQLDQYTRAELGLPTVWETSTPLDGDSTDPPEPEAPA